MKHLLLPALILAAACTQKPAPVSETEPVLPAERPAIAVEYVAVPRANVYARADVTAPVVDSYGLTEAVSILEKKPEWCLVRTFDATGWVRQADLVTGDVAATMDTTSPRFYIAPKEVPFNTRGEIWLQVKVNTEGEVVEAKATKNTTGSQVLADANVQSMMEAKFYPMVDKGTRKTFVYEHRVYY